MESLTANLEEAHANLEKLDHEIKVAKFRLLVVSAVFIVMVGAFGTIATVL